VLKKTQVQHLRPAVKEGFLLKRGANVHSWKKRWFVMKDQYIFYFPKNSGTAVPKGIIELNGDSSAKLLTDQKKPTISIQTVYREQMMQADKLEDAQSWVDAINNHVATLRKKDAPEPTTAIAAENAKIVEGMKSSNPPETVQEVKEEGVKSWEEVKAEIDKHTKWTGDDIRDFMVSVGKATCDEYLYTIMTHVLSKWEDHQIASFWWDDFCDGDLEDLSSVVAGQQGNSTVSVDSDGNPLPQGATVFVLGRDENGAKRLANVYKYVNEKMNFNWSEVTRCILGAISNWRLKTSEPFFITFVNEIVKSWSASEVAAFVSYLFGYAKENKEENWEDWPEHVIVFFKTICSGWDSEKKKSFMNIVTAMWDWNKTSIEKLQTIINQV